jgi:uncharacterized protein (TIGR03066 family)
MEKFAMHRTRFTVGVAFVLALTVAFWAHNASGKDAKADLAKGKLVGVWESTKSEDLPKGSTVEFTKDGKLALQVKAKETVKLEGKYTIDGDKINISVLVEGKEEKDVLTVTKLTDTELVTKDSKNKIDEYKKVVKK